MITKTWRNFDPLEHRVKGDMGISQTIPDQTMSLRTILERYAKGLPISGNNMRPEYDENGDGVNLQALDLAERQAYFESKVEELNILKNQIAEQKKRKKEQDDELFNKRVQQKLDELKVSQNQPVT